MRTGRIPAITARAGLEDNLTISDRNSGLIIAHHGISVEVLFQDGERRTVRVKRNSGHVVGDAVQVTDDVLARLPRRTELRRRDARGGVHLVAANLDVLGIVVAPRTPAGFIDRAVVAARSAGLNPFIAVNKCDLSDSETLFEEIRNAYPAIVPVFPLSAKKGSGIADLMKFLGGYRGAFVGTTGVGKSSLLNALCPEVNLKVGSLSEYGRHGRHTTTVSTLHMLPGGGELVDTPGFRDFGLVDISIDELARHFPGFEALSSSACRFGNCRHRSEPGCAVRDMMQQGRILPQRYAAYLEILSEIETSSSGYRGGGRKK